MHGSTRWLSLQKAVDRNLQLYKSLKSYFLSNRKLIYVEKTNKQYPQTNLTPASKTKFTFPWKIKTKKVVGLFLENVQNWSHTCQRQNTKAQIDLLGLEQAHC